MLIQKVGTTCLPAKGQVFVLSTTNKSFVPAEVFVLSTQAGLTVTFIVGASG